MALPVYQVEFIPTERRLCDDRRTAPPDSPLPPGITADRRKSIDRRTHARAQRQAA